MSGFGLDAPPLTGHRHLAGTSRAALVNRLRRLQLRDTSEAVPQPDRCEFCSGEMGSGHRHALDTHERRILCVCDPCAITLLGKGRYRVTGSRSLQLNDFRLPDELWARFAVPVGLAFFFVSSPAGRVVAIYPSPLGPTESQIDDDAWGALVAANPVLAGLERDIEALLVHRGVRPYRYHLVPIDRCYELVGLVRSSWRGIAGGDEVQRAIAEFFDSIDRYAQ